MKARRTERLLINSRFLLLFMSQDFVSCGAFIQVVAVAKLIVSISNSGFLAGFSIVCAPLPGILVSLFAGRLGDRLKAKNLLLLFDILRGCLVISFSFCRTVPELFVMMILAGMLDVLYSPSRNKTLLTLLTKDQLLRGNSLLNAGYGAVSLIMPALTGVVLGVSGINTVLFISGIFYFLSALALSNLHVQQLPTGQPGGGLQEILEGLRYAFGTPQIKHNILTLAAIDFGAVSVNFAFYSFAFDTLKITSGYWGLLLSVFYGMNIFAMLFLLRHQKKLGGNPLKYSNLFLVVIGVVWFFYATTPGLYAILTAAGVEGFFTALCTTLLTTSLLKAARSDYTARVSGVRDLCSSAAKLLGIGSTYILMLCFGAQTVFIVGAVVLFATVVCRAVLAAVGKTRRKYGCALKGASFYE